MTGVEVPQTRRGMSILGIPLRAYYEPLVKLVIQSKAEIHNSQGAKKTLGPGLRWDDGSHTTWDFCKRLL